MVNFLYSGGQILALTMLGSCSCSRHHLSCSFWQVALSILVLEILIFKGKAKEGLDHMQAVNHATPKSAQQKLIPYKIILLKLSKENVKEEMAQVMEYTPDIQAYAWNCFADMFESQSDQLEARKRGLTLPTLKWHVHAEYKINYAEWLFMLSKNHTEATNIALSTIQDAMAKNLFQSGSCDVSMAFLTVSFTKMLPSFAQLCIQCAPAHY